MVLLLREAAAKAVKRRKLAPIETDLARKMGRMFRAQGAAFVYDLRPQASRFGLVEADGDGLDWEPVWNGAASRISAAGTEAIQAAAEDALQSGMNVAAAEFAGVIADLDTSFDLKNPRAVAFLEGRGAAQIARINETTRDQMRTLLTQAVSEGWSYNRTAKELRAQFTDMSRARALTIATYEAGEAYEAGSYLVGEDLIAAGVAMEKSWLTVGDDRVDPHCAANGGQNWIAFGEAFSSGHDRPLSHPRCRCTLLMRRKP